MTKPGSRPISTLYSMIVFSMKETILQVDERLDRIEMKLSYLEDFVERLQAVVVEQNRLAEKLQQEHRVLKDKILFLTKELEEIPNRKPPHY